MSVETLDPTVTKREVKIGDDTYEVRELSSRSYTAFENARVACRIVSPDGTIIGFRNVADLEPLLVSLTLHDNKGVLVPKPTVDAWPPRVITKLYSIAREISLMDEPSPEKESLKAILANPDCPIKAEDFQSYVLGLEGKEYEPIQRWCKEEVGDTVKN